MASKPSKPSNLCTKCGVAWNAETGKYPCPKGGKCEIPAADTRVRSEPR